MAWADKMQHLWSTCQFTSTGEQTCQLPARASVENMTPCQCASSS